MIEGYAKQLCPVDTGNLRNSITHEQESENVEVIGSPVEYAPFVEFGHHTASGSKVAEQPYLRPAFENHRAEIENVIKTELGKI